MINLPHFLFRLWKTINKSLGKNWKKSEALFVAMSMMNLCAKFHEDSPSGKKLNSLSRARLNFRRWPILCTTMYRNLYKPATSVAHLTNFSFEFFMRFSQKMPNYAFILWCKKKKSKWPEWHFRLRCPHFLLSCLKFSTYICPSELHPLIWSFFKNSFRKMKKCPKTTQNALAPSVF